MNTTGLVKYAGAAASLAILSACGGTAVAPSSASLNETYIGRTLSVNGRLVTAARLGSPPSYAGILPDRPMKAQPETYEYIISDYGTYASIFDYPKSHKQIGSITNVGGQGCTNVLYGYGKKTFWIVAADNQIEEFTVPKTPVKTLSDSVGAPSSCAMDANGDLAVGILYDSGGPGGGDIVIFKHASGKGTVYTTPLHREYFDGYDNKGNLFFDGFTGSYNFELVELPKGSKKLLPIKTSNTVEFPGSVQWDGKYLTVTDQTADAMYQYTVSGEQATLKGTVSLSGAGDCAQTWIATHVVYCADAGSGGGEVFKYPAGGSAIAVFSGEFDLPLGTVAAEK